MVLMPKRLAYVLFFFLPITALKAQQANIEFTENKGQWDQQVKFQGDVSAGAFFISRLNTSTLIYDLGQTDSLNFKPRPNNDLDAWP